MTFNLPREFPTRPVDTDMARLKDTFLVMLLRAEGGAFSVNDYDLMALDRRLNHPLQLPAFQIESHHSGTTWTHTIRLLEE